MMVLFNMCIHKLHVSFTKHEDTYGGCLFPSDFGSLVLYFHFSYFEDLMWGVSLIKELTQKMREGRNRNILECSSSCWTGGIRILSDFLPSSAAWTL